MTRRIPPDAFSYYVALGPARSFEGVALKYGVSKRGIAEVAKRERWKERLAEIEAQARRSADAKAAESIEAMNERHLKEVRYLQSKGLDGLKSGRAEIASVSVKALTAGGPASSG